MDNSNRQPRSISRLWEHYISRYWHEYHWTIIGVLALAAFVLGVIGFHRYFSALGKPVSIWDLVYLTLQLFTLESGSVTGALSWQLQIARLLAPGVLVYTAARALLEVFRDQLQLFRVRFARNHVVICGLGEKGYRLAISCVKQGYRVVLLEVDSANSRIRNCRSRGMIVLAGDATDIEQLRRAGVTRARYLFSVLGDAGDNAEVAVSVRDIVTNDRKGILTCFIHIAAPELAILLREKEIAAQKPEAFRLEFFNVSERGARALLHQYPAMTGAESEKTKPPAILVVGLGSLGSAGIIQLAKLRYEMFKTDGEPVPITIVDERAEEKKALLLSRYPQLGLVCKLIARQIDVNASEFLQADFLFNTQGQCLISKAYVTLDDDVQCLSAALSLRQHLKAQRIPIVVSMAHDAGLARLLEGKDGSGQDFDNLHAFGLLDRTCTAELLTQGTNEILAREVHEAYVRDRLRAGETRVTNAALAPWSELDEKFRNSNREQADHMTDALMMAGCGIAPTYAWASELYRFSDNDIELLAEREHERFVRERRREGWTYAPPPKDPDRKTSPWLVSWADLPEEIKNIDRNTIRNIPAFLSVAGFEVYARKKQSDQVSGMEALCG